MDERKAERRSGKTLVQQIRNNVQDTPRSRVLQSRHFVVPQALGVDCIEPQEWSQKQQENQKDDSRSLITQTCKTQ